MEQPGETALGRERELASIDAWLAGVPGAAAPAPLRAEAGDGPLVLALDDAQWLDPVSFPSARPGQKVLGHQGAGSHDIAVESAAREPGVASVIRPALAIALSPVPPRY